MGICLGYNLLMDLRALYKISYGLYIVSARLGEKLNGQIANSVFQITSEPPRLAVGICKANLTHKFISESGAFCVSILSKEAPLPFIGRFGYKSGRDTDKFDGVNQCDATSGSPIVLDNTIGHIDVKVEQSMDVGTHTLFVGLVVDAEVLDGEPLTYAEYHRIKSGNVKPEAKAAPMEVSEADIVGGDKYRCLVCNYIYDPSVGDPEGGIAPGTLFEDLPDDWTCPICGATKDEFTKEN